MRISEWLEVSKLDRIPSQSRCTSLVLFYTIYQDLRDL